MRRPKFSLLSLLLFTLLIASTTTFILNAPAWKTIPLNTTHLLGSTFSPSGRFLAIDYEIPMPELRRTGNQKVPERERRLAIYDAQRGYKLIETAEYFRGTILTFSSDERLLLTAKDNTPVLWDWSSNKVVHTFDENSVVLKHDAYYYAFDASHSNFWLIPESNLNHKIELDGPFSDIDFSKDQHRALTLSSNGTAIVYELPTGDILSRIYERYEKDTIIRLSPDGTTAAFTHNNVVRLYSIDASIPMRLLNGHTKTIQEILFLPSGNLVSSSEDGTIREWNTQLGSEIPCSQFGQYEMQKHINLQSIKFKLFALGPIAQYPDNTRNPSAILDREHRRQFFLKIQTRPDHWWTFIYLPEFWTTLVLASLFLWNLFRKPK